MNPCPLLLICRLRLSPKNTLLNDLLLQLTKESSATSIYTLPSLVDLTFVPALNCALQTGETDRTDPFMWLPGNVSRIKETLRAHNPLSAIGFARLSKVEVTQTKSIDLSHFSLTTERLIELLSAHEGAGGGLNISYMQQITMGILRQLISLPTCDVLFFCTLSLMSISCLDFQRASNYFIVSTL